MFRSLCNSVLAGAVLLLSSVHPALADADRDDVAVAETSGDYELALVYVYNRSDYYVRFYVDGDYKTGIDPHSYATVGVEVGTRTFFSDKAGDGIDSMVRVNVPSGGRSYYID